MRGPEDRNLDFLKYKQILAYQQGESGADMILISALYRLLEVSSIRDDKALF